MSSHRYLAEFVNKFDCYYDVRAVLQRLIHYAQVSQTSSTSASCRTQKGRWYGLTLSPWNNKRYPCENEVELRGKFGSDITNPLLST